MMIVFGSNSKMLTNFKENSWVVRLSEGFVVDNTVKGVNCHDCKSPRELLRINYGDPNLLLYACNDSKCQHKLLRLSFKQTN